MNVDWILCAHEICSNLLPAKQSFQQTIWIFHHISLSIHCRNITVASEVLQNENVQIEDYETQTHK